MRIQVIVGALALAVLVVASISMVLHIYAYRKSTSIMGGSNQVGFYDPDSSAPNQKLSSVTDPTTLTSPSQGSMEPEFVSKKSTVFDASDSSDISVDQDAQHAPISNEIEYSFIGQFVRKINEVNIDDRIHEIFEIQVLKEAYPKLEGTIVARWEIPDKHWFEREIGKDFRFYISHDLLTGEYIIETFGIVLWPDAEE